MALVCEPLKAAWEAGERPGRCRCLAISSPSSLKDLEAASKSLRLEGIKHLLRNSPMNSRICQTSAASPAEPGDLPNGLEIGDLACREVPERTGQISNLKRFSLPLFLRCQLRRFTESVSIAKHCFSVIGAQERSPGLMPGATLYPSGLKGNA